MTSFVSGKEHIDVPGYVQGFESFRRWLHTPDFPETGKLCFINDRVWVDLTMEEFESHNQVRTEIVAVLHFLVKRMKFGKYLSEGMRYSHPETNLSTEPDGMVISNEAVASEKVRFVGGRDGDQTEMVGTPDIVIEVVSCSSEVKDAEWAVDSYFNAGILEYWLVDARDKDDIRFETGEAGTGTSRPARQADG